jgi:hypothetical protein
MESFVRNSGRDHRRLFPKEDRQVAKERGRLPFKAQESQRPWDTGDSQVIVV